MRSLMLALVVAVLAMPVAQAGEPHTSFKTTKGKAQVPVTPKQTISTVNRKAGMSFNADGSLKTRKLPSGQTVGDAKKASGK